MTILEFCYHLFSLERNICISYIFFERTHVPFIFLFVHIYIYTCWFISSDFFREIFF
jgi:hypothetical protein